MADTKPFVQKLYTMVDDAATARIIGWTADGGAFQILQLEPFTKTQLPTYFKHGNLSSFVRQLNTYGFSKVDQNAWVFSHPDFVRGDAERLARIQRKSSHRPAASDELPMPDGMDQLVPLSGGHHHGHGAAATSSSAAAANGAASAAEVASMRRRIELLNREVSQARAQQADTRASIGKIMEFLSQMYREQRRANAGAVAAGGVGMVPPTMLPQLPAPPLHPPPEQEAAQMSKRQRTDTTSVKLEQSQQQTQDKDAAAAGTPPFLHLQPQTLSRQSSLGAQVASALPMDLRELALELAGDTELQDRTLNDIRSNSGNGNANNRGNGGQGLMELEGGGGGGSQNNASGLGDGEEEDDGEANGGVPDDVDAYLWDFIETSQELATAAEADSSKATA